MRTRDGSKRERECARVQSSNLLPSYVTRERKNSRAQFYIFCSITGESGNSYTLFNSLTFSEFEHISNETTNNKQKHFFGVFICLNRRQVWSMRICDNVLMCLSWSHAHFSLRFAVVVVVIAVVNIILDFLFLCRSMIWVMFNFNETRHIKFIWKFIQLTKNLFAIHSHSAMTIPAAIIIIIIHTHINHPINVFSIWTKITNEHSHCKEYIYIYNRKYDCQYWCWSLSCVGFFSVRFWLCIYIYNFCSLRAYKMYTQLCNSGFRSSLITMYMR